MPEQLPHHDYITAITDAFTDVGLDPAHTTLDDCDTRGTYCYLRAVLTFTPEDTYGVDATQWPHGLLLIWEWHTGLEAADGEPERGPVWLWAKCLPDGANSTPTPLPVDGVANPIQLGFALAEVINTGVAKTRRIGRWVCAPALAAACEAWGSEESGEQ